MPRQKGPEWSHVIIVGDPSKKNQDMKCIYCQAQFSGGAVRIRSHLTGESLAGGGVKQCLQVP